MTTEVQSQIDLVAQLQDIEIRMARTERDAQIEARRRDDLETRLAASEFRLTEARAAIDQLRKSYREQERIVEINADQVKKSQAKLMSVKTNKEYQAMLVEIDQIEATNSAIEDKMLALLDEIDVAESQLRVIQADHTAVIADVDSDRETIGERIRELAADGQRLAEDRQDLLQDIDDKIRAKFEHVRTRHADRVGISRVVQGNCQGCKINIPPQLYNELHRMDAVHLCPNCQRMIYWRPDE